MAQAFGSVVISLSTYQEVSGSIIGSTVVFFSSGELFHGMYGLGASEFHCPLFMSCPMLSSEYALVFC